jgi:ubiquinone/menaquinone biosynthesis C-methylase UbiE
VQVLDLGCGKGRNLYFSHLPITPKDSLIGCDIGPLDGAARKFPERMFIQARGEALPFRDAHFDSVVCLLALPYMHIPRAFAEARQTFLERSSLALYSQ